MNIFETIKASSPPQVLFHYTSQAGLIGIVKSAQLWATKIQFLNDASEMKFGTDAARHELSEYAKILTDRDQQQVLISTIEALDRIGRVNLCVACFSTQRNLLSQWRAYGGKGVGYCIGFNAARLQGLAGLQSFYLAPCVYDHVKQKSLLREAIEIKISEYEHSLSKTRSQPAFDKAKHQETYTWRFLNAILERLPLIKNPVFSEECEWRLISPLISNLDSRFGVRSTQSCLVPHFEFSLRDKDENFRLDEIIMGPTPVGWDGLEGLGLLLVRNNAYCERLSVTNIPYRQL